jgi:hypothetical protein
MNYQEVADQVHTNAGQAGPSAGAVVAHNAPRSFAEVEARTAEVARTTAERAQALRSPRGTVYPGDAK